MLRKLLLFGLGPCSSGKEEEKKKEEKVSGKSKTGKLQGRARA